MERIFIGIDPGLTGAVAVIWPHDPPAFIDTPTLQVAKTGKRDYDAAEMAAAVARVVDCARGANLMVLVALEKAQAMPAALHGRAQGVSSSFRTGLGFGLWLGILAASGAPYELVAPASWKRAMMADSPKEKDASLLVAKRLFPQAADQLTRKKDHGRADALLIAEFVRRRSGGNDRTTPTLGIPLHEVWPY